MKNLAVQLLFTTLGMFPLLGDGPALNITAQEMTVRLTIPVEENLGEIEEYWTTVPEFLGRVRSLSGAEQKSLRTILSVGFPVEIDLRYEDEGIPYFFRFWIKDGEIVRSFVRSTVTEHALGPDLGKVQEKIERIMEERFREVRKQSNEAVDDLQRGAAEQRKIIEDIERRHREDSENSGHPDQG